MKDKVAIITWCDNSGPSNYGQVLQCYALQKMVHILGKEAIVIQYRQKDRHDFIPFNISIPVCNQVYELIYKILKVEKTYNGRIHRFRSFIRRYIPLTYPCYEEGDIKKITASCKYLISGSDQLWNPSKYDSIYYLTFAKKEQIKIAYAPSGIFDVNSSNKHIVKKIAKHMENMDYVSVRERISKDILDRYCEKEIECVLDPTLLLTRRYWDTISSKQLIKEKYIFLYLMGNMKDYSYLIKKVKEDYEGAQVIYIPSNIVEDCFEDGIACKNVGPSEFLSLIRYSEAVCTDSYHGMLLSIQYEKPFYIMKRKDDSRKHWSSMARIQNVLETLHLKNRVIASIMDLKKVEDINYIEINQYIRKERKKSYAYLYHSLNNLNHEERMLENEK